MTFCCRLCLTENFNNFTLYKCINKKYLPGVINNISGVKILKENEPEAKICHRCAASVLVAENIILQCQESEQYFQYQLSQKTRLNISSPIGKPSNQYEKKPVSYRNVAEEIHANKSSSDCDNELGLNIKNQTDTSISSGKAKRNKISPNKRVKRIATTVAIFNCNHCDYTTKTGKRIIEHKQTVHGVYDPNIYACTHCSQSFSWKPTLYRHIELDHKTMPEDKRYLCNECGRAYMREIHLVEHIKQRHGPRKFKCPDPLCEQSFARTFTLRRHFITTHTGQTTNTRYHCVDCDKYFKIYDQWKYHNEIVHKNDIVYCPHCGYPFRLKDKLQEHLIKNVCKRSVVPCSYCQRRFTTKNGLREHVRSIHSIFK